MKPSPWKSHWKWAVWLSICLGLCAAAATDPRGWRQYVKLRDEVSGLSAKNRLAARENQRLSREAHALKENPAAIARAIREELGFIHPGEMVLQLRPEGTDPK
jgi:cell division protein FtsB